MSQKTEKLDKVLNPSTYGTYYPRDSDKREITDEDKERAETAIYNEVVEGLEEDIKNLGMDITYSSRIIIGDIARNIVLLGRIKTGFIERDILTDKKVVRPTHLSKKRDPADPYNHSKSIYYDIIFVHGSEEINPVFDKLIPKIQKQIINGLRVLGLLPVQQIEKQKLTVIKRLKQKVEEIDKEYSIKAEKEILTPKKKNKTKAAEEVVVEADK